MGKGTLDWEPYMGSGKNYKGSGNTFPRVNHVVRGSYLISWGKSSGAGVIFPRAGKEELLSQEAASGEEEHTIPCQRANLDYPSN